MKVTVNLEEGETLEQAEEELYKALRGKKKIKDQLGERYADEMINEFHDRVLDEHFKVLEEIKERVKYEVNKLAST